MTNEEAIQTIKSECYISDLLNLDRTRMVNSALDKAVEALKAEPCEDCISRQDALDAFGLSEKTRKYGGDHSGYDTMMLYEIQDVLEDLPSVTPTITEKETVEDAISRQVVLDLFAGKCDAVRPYHEVWQAVKDLPSVKPIRPKGKWIHWDENEYGNTAECSECKGAFYACDGGRVEDIYKYCPNCGAEMEVDK